MDEQIPSLNNGDNLPESDRVYRISLNTQRDRKNKKIPSVSCFSLSPSDKDNGFKLSTDWEKKTTPEESIARVGCSYKGGTNNFKPYDNREIYAINVEFVKSITGIDRVIFDPVIKENPPIGEPHNPAHSSIVFQKEDFDKNEPEILLKIRNHATDQKIDFEITEVDRMVQEYRKQVQNIKKD